MTTAKKKSEATTRKRNRGSLHAVVVRIPKHEWNKSKPMWVIGAIDSYGAIRGRAAKNPNHSPTHSAEDGPGRRWRWNVWGQDFHSVLGSDKNITPEECALVKDWLERHGYIYPHNASS